MPRYYCDYCDTYLTHDSPSVRKQHNAGYKHKANVRSYYQQFEEQQTQSLIDQRIKEHLGQAAAFQQVGAAYNQHLLQRPRLPVLPTPMMPIPGSAQLPANTPLMPGIRPPPVLPRPVPAAPGYMSSPAMPPMVAPPGAPSLPGQVNGLPRPPMSIPPATVPGSAAVAPPSGAPSMVPPASYQTNPAPPTSAGFDSFNNTPNLEANH
ncbi:U1 small nuclear ribonucleoprotein C [Ricinus communis]|uniref:U1 small nuclear ribonucleoprotein C n=1 Tax=Ricinus communis TaxID=3988 RepID=B9S3X9_RICCO|nr:U1 small nuclear ribonucleoprotein C [Ricinus communis]EEF41660.1 U1 small nuclear ribonucleoprotein C, putative [Ricinus communis]|eukprot:XP_002520698.1 U1 small nuclear ribonucleoprotein C [Ricinus communis]